MHSSRMRTVRSCSRLLGGGRWCLPVGMCLPWGVCPGEVSAWGVSAQGMSAWGVCIPACIGGRHPQPVDRMTDTCKNITFLELCLRTVMKKGNPSSLSFASSTFRKSNYFYTLNVKCFDFNMDIYPKKVLELFS